MLALLAICDSLRIPHGTSKGIKLTQDQKWTKERIVRTIQENAFGYQNVELPYGLATGGVDRSRTAKSIFGVNIIGKSVFDLGCRFGFFCFFAEEQGATDIVGVDVDPENIRKARLLADMRESKVKFEQFDIEKGNFDRSFDYVLCLNILHHLRNPLLALDKLISATREVLVLELAGFSFRDRRQNHVLLPIAALLNRLPVLYVARQSSKTYFVTTEAIRVILLEKRADFARIDVVPAGPKGRPIVLAHRRRIRRLLIIAGLPASGKSTLIDYLRNSQSGEAAQQLGFDPTLGWDVLPFGNLREYTEPEMNNVIVHYNITKHLVDGDLYLHSNALSDVIGIAQEVKIVTLACPRERLLRQFTENRINKPGKLFDDKRRKKKIRRIVKLCENQLSLNELYADWFKFVESSKFESFIFKHDGGAYEISQGNSLENY